VLHAAVLHDHLVGGARSNAGVGAAELGAGLARFRRGSAYAARGGLLPSHRFYDDNAWVGLAAAQAVLLRPDVPGPQRLADRLARWCARGEDRTLGGVRWRPGLASRHACSTGSLGLLVLRAVPPGQRPGTDVLALARRCQQFLAGLLRESGGLVGDNVGPGDRRDPTLHSYNQGLSVGLDVALHDAGEPGALERARRTAARALDRFSHGDALWQQPPAFNAIFFRLLLLLHAFDGDPAWPSAATAYLERVLAQGLRDDGLVGAGGIGSYGSDVVLDQAGVVQLAVLGGLEPADLALLT
jgi:hypothetical protein